MSSMFRALFRRRLPPRPYTVSELLAEVGDLCARPGATSPSSAKSAGGTSGGPWLLHAEGPHRLLERDHLRLGPRARPVQRHAGLEVVVRGSLDLWAPQGKFQIKASAIEPVGAGALQLAFEQLKAKLAAEGSSTRRASARIPALPARIAIVTSPTGAAIRDILNILRRRHDGLSVTIYPVRVQGEGSAADVAEGIRRLEQPGRFRRPDRGARRRIPEDLAPFNDERVARALAASRIPTISAIGHESDVTIADLVADLARADFLGRGGARRRKEGRPRPPALRLPGTGDPRPARQDRDRTRARLTGLSRAEGLLRFRYKLRGSGRSASARA